MIPYTMFGKTRMVPLRVYKDGRLLESPKPVWDHDLWVERAEDQYALMGIKGRVLVVYADEWRRGPTANL